MKRVWHGDLGGQLGEALLGDRVAVDPDQRPAGADPLGDQARVAAAADRAVDRGLARAAGRADRSARRPAPGCASWSCQAVSPRLAAMSGIRVRTSSRFVARSARDPRPRRTRRSRSPRPPCRGRRSASVAGGIITRLAVSSSTSNDALKKKRLSSRAFGDAGSARRAIDGVKSS